MKLDPYSEQLLLWAKEVVAYLVVSGVPHSDAEDVVQDVFVRLLEAEFILPARKIRAWMYRVAIRRYIDLYRRDRKYQDILQEQFFRSEEILVFDQEAYQPLYDALKTVSQSQQLALELYYFQGFTVAEIAHILSVSQSKIKMDLARGRKRLKEWMEKEGIENGII